MGCGTEHGLISIDEALQRIATQVKPLASEAIGLQDGLNRYLAEDIYSHINLPLFSQSAVDGYAINAASDITADTVFHLIGEIRAGQLSDVVLNEGQAVRIFTGAKVPQSTSTVARQEIVKVVDSHAIQIQTTLALDSDIRHTGEEIRLGQYLAQQGQQLSVGAIAALSMAGVSTVQVYQYPKVAVVVSGDEVATSIAEFQAGKIFDANAPMFAAWFRSQLQQVEIYHIADDRQATAELFHRLKHQVDVIVTTGGVSVGDYDFIRPVALEQDFQQIFWKIRQKPGKPMFFAKYAKSDTQDCYLLGLAGNPAAVFVGIYIYLDSLLKALQSQANTLHWFDAVLMQNLKADSRERFLRMSAQTLNGQLQVQPLAKQQSHMLSNLMQANCLVRIPAYSEIQAGTLVQGIFI